MVIIIEWIVGLLIGFWLLAAGAEILIALIGGLYGMYSEQRYRRRYRRKAFEEMPREPIKTDFKFKYLRPRKK